MHPRDEYRRNALECFKLADEVIYPENKDALVKIAQGWLRLAEQASRNDITDSVHKVDLRSAS
jgi:hypothetical protein